MAPEGGYAVDPGKVDAAGRSACDLAEELRSIRSTWDNATRDGAAACGLDETGAAYAELQDAWFAEIGVHITLLTDVCEAMRSAARGYADTEEAHTAALNGAEGGQ